ncbi:MAG: hypothetical protein Q9182_001462 [Xanthomendoza sp. 2 TL-2023]
MEEASQQADSLQEKDGRGHDGFVVRVPDSSREGEIASLRRLVAEMAKIVMEICKLELNAVSPKQAQPEGNTLVERANQAVEDFRAAATSGANGLSALASRRRLNKPIRTARLRDSLRDQFEHSAGRRQYRSATMPPSASQWFGLSVDRASRQLTGTSHGVGNEDGQYDGVRRAKQERRDRQQVTNNSRYGSSTPATGGSTRLRNDPFAPSPKRSQSLFLSGPVSPDEQGRSPSQALVPKSAKAVEERQGERITYSIILPKNPAQSVTPSEHRERSRQASTISPCQRSIKHNGHVQVKGLQSKQHVGCATARDRSRQPTISHTALVPTIPIDRTNMHKQMSLSGVPNMPASTRNFMAPSIVSAASLSSAAPSRGVHSISVNAHSGVAGQAEALEKGSPGGITGGSTSVEPGNSCSKRRANSIAGESYIPDHGRAKQPKLGGQGRSCGKDRFGSSHAKEVQHIQGRQCSMMLDSGMTSGKGLDLSTMVTSPVSKSGNYGRKVETSREDSELPDLATIIQQFPASLKHAGSQRYAGNQGSEMQAPARDQEPQDASAGSRLYNTTNPGPTGTWSPLRKRRHSNNTSTNKWPATERSGNATEPPSKRARQGTFPNENNSCNPSFSRPTCYDSASRQTHPAASLAPPRYPSSWKRYLSHTKGFSSGQTFASSGTARPRNGPQIPRGPRRSNCISGAFPTFRKWNSQSMDRGNNVRKLRQPWEFHPDNRVVSNPVPKLKPQRSSCRCSCLPDYFYDDTNEKPSLSTWPGCKEEFLVHCEQVEACSGHSNVMREACREALRAEQSSMRV